MTKALLALVLALGLLHAPVRAQEAAEDPGLVDREFGNYFPSMSYSFSPSDNHTFQASYSKRITRPTYQDMAPFVFFIGPATDVGGNPGLWPAIANNLDGSYSYKFWWISVKYSDIENTINWLQPEVYPETFRVTTRSHNGDFERMWTVSTGLPVSITSWVNCGSSGSW